MNDESLLIATLLATANFSQASNPPFSIHNDQVSGENYDSDDTNKMLTDIKKRKLANTRSGFFSLSDHSKAKPP